MKKNIKATYLISRKIFGDYITNNESLDDRFIYEEMEDFECKLSEYNGFIKKCDSPIEEIMFGVLLNCGRNFDTAEYIYPFKISGEIMSQIKIGKYRADFVVYVALTARKNDFEIARFVIECDGHDFHEKTKEQVKRDKERDRFISSEGFTVLRFSGSEIYSDTQKVLSELKTIFRKKIKDVIKERRKEYIEYVVEGEAEYEG